MAPEQSPTIPDAENLYRNHKIDVEAARQLGGLAYVGQAEPGAELSKRSEYILDRVDGDVHAAASQAKHDIAKHAQISGQIISENLDQYVDQAREDMEWDKIKQIQDARYGEGPRILSRESVYKMRRERGMPLGGDEPGTPRRPLRHMEAQRAINPVTGQSENVLPLSRPY